ncbi:MAG: diacylglycerol kinase family protein [Roseitalea porphyridii]|jgi:diacylglycerol kinase family enzyme|uniref:diacylglycerol/lipid kinase family protein n=1 Tax=Roseitalea porphyridii TaxID=1852022 RepID=UPI0032ED421A
MTGRSFAGVINPGASTLKALDADALRARIADALGARGDLIAFSDPDTDAVEALRAAAADDDHDGLLVAGGDGTVSLAAGLCAQAGKTLAIVPGGNMNLYARSLGLPLDPFAAAEALAGFRVRPVDIAYANDRPFIHEFSLGLHPELIADRDKVKYGSRLGKLVGTARSALRVIARPPRVRVWLDGVRGPEPLITPGVAISNNPFSPGHLPFADRLDSGLLGVYILTSERSADVAALAAALQTGTWQDLAFVRSETARRVRLRRARPMRAAIDGELVTMEGPIDIRTDPGGLTVLAPAKQPDEMVSQTD